MLSGSPSARSLLANVCFDTARSIYATGTAVAFVVAGNLGTSLARTSGHASVRDHAQNLSCGGRVAFRLWRDRVWRRVDKRRADVDQRAERRWFGHCAGSGQRNAEPDSAAESNAESEAAAGDRRLHVDPGEQRTQ